jgi:hypothetical protein
MNTLNGALRIIEARGPRWAVSGTIRPREVIAEYAATATTAEAIKDRYEANGYHQIQVYPPQPGVDLAALGRVREEKQRELAEATAILRAGVLRALEDGRAEAEVARTAGVDRMTVRTWAGK